MTGRLQRTSVPPHDREADRGVAEELHDRPIGVHGGGDGLTEAIPREI
jgi:hypothetical protein